VFYDKGIALYEIKYYTDMNPTRLKISIFIFTTLILTILSCSSSREIIVSRSVDPLTDTTTLRTGTLVYALPRTVLTVSIETRREISIPGPYARFAGDMLGLDNVIKSETEAWTIRKISISSRTEPDPSKYYVINSNTQYSSNILSLRREGLIIDLNPEILPGASEVQISSGIEGNVHRSFDLGSDEYSVIQRDTAFRRVSLDSTFIRIPYVVEKRRRLSTEQLAERASKRLMEIREGKILVLTGEANVFPQNEAAINELNRLEREYTELFTGKRFTETAVYTYNIIPQSNDSGKPVVVLSFSEVTGPSAGSSGKGKPVTIDFIRESESGNLKVISPESIGSFGNTNDDLYYRVPEMVNLRIKYGDEELFSSRRLIYQFGSIIRLPGIFMIGKYY